MSTTHRVWLAALSLAVAPLFLAACGEDGDRPSVDPTRTSTVQPTRSPDLPTRSPDNGESPTASESVEEPSRTPEETEEPSRTPEETEEPSRTPDESEEPPRTPDATDEGTPSDDAADEGTTDDGTTDEDATDVPSWVWWLLAALAVLLAVGIPLLVRSRRRGAWKSDLSAAEAEVAWFAHELVPELRRTGSREQAVGGWTVSSERVRTLEDRLTALEATAPDDPAQRQARILRDAVRAARGRLDGLAASASMLSPTPELDSVASDLESALARVGPQTP